MSFYKAVIDLLGEANYKYDRPAKGSHEYWCKDGKDCVSVPRNLKSRHTANGILKDAGIKKKL
jgi:predicted RNA binding protein YcfA (HicA-like mRNA interferase family)